MSKQKKIKVGVFDSGIGGLSVAQAIEKHLPNVDVMFVNDTKNVPYGTKTPKLILTFVLPILKKMVDKGCDVLVIACNTVSTTLLDEIKKEIKIPILGMYPMVKTAAAQTKSGIIAVCATPVTLNSPKYQQLLETHAKHLSVIEPDCSNWTSMIENNEIDHKFISNQIKNVCKQGADVIVLGCTHYHWIEEEIRIAAEGRAIVLQPEQAVIRRLVTVIDDLK